MVLCLLLSHFRLGLQPIVYFMPLSVNLSIENR
jgi:hypothetical protein